MTARTPLCGLRVIDLSRVLAGPFAGQILADLGADVLKIEPPDGDETRRWGPPFLNQDDENPPTSAYFQGLNRSKTNRVLDFKLNQDRLILLDFLTDADVLIENFKAGTLEKWGLDDDLIATRFPRLIHCRISGFGRGGVYDGLPGYDAVIQAMTGLMSVNGVPETGPVRVGTPVVDISTGHYSAIAVLAAINERNHSGVGQLIELSLYDVGLSLLHPHAANWLAGGNQPRLQGNSHPNIAPYDMFETATGSLYLAVGNDRQFGILANYLGASELSANPLFATNADRLKNRAALLSSLSELLCTLDGHVLSIDLLHAGVPAGMVNTVPQALAARHSIDRNCIAEAKDYSGIASPMRFSRTPVLPARAPRCFNADQPSNDQK